MPFNLDIYETHRIGHQRPSGQTSIVKNKIFYDLTNVCIYIYWNYNVDIPEYFSSWNRYFHFIYCTVVFIIF
jgi:hypothetical protein